MKRWTAVLLLAVYALFLSGCGANLDADTEANGSAGSRLSGISDPTRVKSDSALQRRRDFFFENKIPLEDQPVYLETKGVAYDSKDPKQQEVVTVSFESGGITNAPDPEDPEFKIVTVTMTAAAHVPYDTEKKRAQNLCFSAGIFDRYTGRMLPEETLTGDGKVTGTLTLDYKGERCEISYTKSNVWDSNLIEEEEKLAHLCTMTYVLRVPASYDGLVFGAIAQTQYLPDGEGFYDLSSLAQAAGYDLSQSVFFGFGQENPTDSTAAKDQTP